MDADNHSFNADRFKELMEKNLGGGIKFFDRGNSVSNFLVNAKTYLNRAVTNEELFSALKESCKAIGYEIIHDSVDIDQENELITLKITKEKTKLAVATTNAAQAPFCILITVAKLR